MAGPRIVASLLSVAAESAAVAAPQALQPDRAYVFALVNVCEHVCERVYVHIYSHVDFPCNGKLNEYTQGLCVCMFN